VVGAAETVLPVQRRWPFLILPMQRSRKRVGAPGLP
jgi:hypothetical protein